MNSLRQMGARLLLAFNALFAMLRNWWVNTAIPVVKRMVGGAFGWLKHSAWPFFKGIINSVWNWVRYTFYPFLKRNAVRFLKWLWDDVRPFLIRHRVWVWLIASIIGMIWSIFDPSISKSAIFWWGVSIVAAVITINKWWPAILNYLKVRSLKLLNWLIKSMSGGHGILLYLVTCGPLFLLAGLLIRGDLGLMIVALGWFFCLGAMVLGGYRVFEKIYNLFIKP